MMTFPVRPRTLDELKKLSAPQAVAGGQSEALAWILYDTATVLNTSTFLTYYGTSRANLQLSNLNGRGLPEPQYFEGYFYGCDVLRAPGNVDAIGDVWKVMNGTGAIGTGAPTWTFVLADKNWGPFPLRAFHTLGSVRGYSTRTAQEYATTGFADGGFSGDGAMVIPPNQTFSVTANWSVALGTLTASVDLVVWMAGVLHRRVL